MEDNKKDIRYIGPMSLKDDDLHLLMEIVNICYYSDPQVKILLDLKEDELIGHITTSNPDFRKSIIDNLLFINKHMNFKVKYSSSLAISKIISFIISLT